TWSGRAGVYTEEQPLRAVLSVPMTWQGQVTGVIHVLHDEPHRFTQAHLELLTQFGAHAAVAVQNTRLLAEARHHAQEQRLLFAAARDFSAGLDEAGTLQAIARHIVRALNVLHCLVCRRDQAADSLITLLDYDLTTGRGPIRLPGEACALSGLPASRAVLETRQPLVVRADDPRADPAEQALLKENGFQHLLILPLAGPRVEQSGAGQQSVFGLISAFRDSSQPAFSDAEVQLGQSLAAQAAVALENVSLHAAERQRARELDALLTASGALLSTLELESLLLNVLTAALAAIPAAHKGTILLLNPESGLLECRAIIGYDDPRVRTSSFPTSRGYSAQAMREKRPLQINDARADPAICYEGEIEEIREIFSAIVAPLLLHDGQGLGVISLDATVRAAFDPDDLRLLEAFANTAAVAIDHARLHAEVQQLAVTDALTGLANRRAFDALFHTEVARAARYGHPLSLIFADVDDFKLYNDTWGHPAGDERLKAVARLLQASVRDPDVAARYGGEEFVLVLPHTGKAGAAALAERIRVAAQAGAPRRLAGWQGGHSPGSSLPGYTLSLGVAAFPEDGATAEQLLLGADNAALAAKRDGKNRVVAAGAPATPPGTD
ncbi:MAG: diguanylate cyclase, partial [Chloroflexi bacterium]|nr:diguanylate cyclase [Chloroflexota bacterium]